MASKRTRGKGRGGGRRGKNKKAPKKLSPRLAEPCALPASHISIAVAEGTALADEQNFALYLQLVLSKQQTVLRRHQLYSLQYETSRVCFWLLEGRHYAARVAGAVLDQPRGVLDQPLRRDGFLVHCSTAIKLQVYQPKRSGPSIAGYDTQLRPLYQQIHKLFSKPKQQENFQFQQQIRTIFASKRTVMDVAGPSGNASSKPAAHRAIRGSKNRNTGSVLQSTPNSAAPDDDSLSNRLAVCSLNDQSLNNQSLKDQLLNDQSLKDQSLKDQCLKSALKQTKLHRKLCSDDPCLEASSPVSRQRVVSFGPGGAGRLEAAKGVLVTGGSGRKQKVVSFGPGGAGRLEAAKDVLVTGGSGRKQRVVSFGPGGAGKLETAKGVLVTGGSGRKQRVVSIGPGGAGKLETAKGVLVTGGSGRKQRVVSFGPGGAGRLEAAKGVLVTGGSGCGKTLLLRHLHATCPSVMYGKTTNSLTVLFDLAAAKAPCLLLLDDVHRTRKLKKLHSCLASLPGQVLVVCTASEERHVAPSLLQSRRLSLHLALPRPDPAARAAILQTLLTQAGLRYSSAMVSELSTQSHGATGQDLNHIVFCLLENGDMELNNENVARAIDQHKLLMQSMMTRSNLMKKNTAVKKTEKNINVCGYLKEFKELDNCFHLSLNCGAVYKGMGISPPTRILLFGPSGCGKTWLAAAIAEKYCLAVRTVTRADVFGKYFGESEANLSKIFQEAVEAAPCILHFPGFDGLASVKSRDQHEVESRVVNLLKARLDGMIPLNGLFVIAETSRPDLLDPAIVRRGRFHAHLHVGLPDSEAREQLTRHLLEDLRPSDECCHLLAQHTHGYTVAEVEQVCRQVRVAGWSDLPALAASVTVGTTPAILKRNEKFKFTYEIELW